MAHRPVQLESNGKDCSMNAMIKPKAARPYIRGKALEAKQAATHAALREWVMMRKLEAELLPKLAGIPAPAIIERDPFKAYRAEFAHMNSISAGRAMAAKIVADTKAEQIDMAELERGIGEAVDDDMSLYAEWPELNDLEFQRTGGLV